MANELLPCPFCGAPARQSSGGAGTAMRFGTGCGHLNGCPASLFALIHARQDMADAAWNHRATPEGKEANAGDAELNDLRVQLAASQASVSHLSRLADYWLALYDVPDDMMGQPGIPCVALPDGPKNGKYLNGDDAVVAVRAVIAARAGKTASRVDCGECPAIMWGCEAGKCLKSIRAV